MYAALRGRDLDELVRSLHPQVRMVLSAGMPLDLGGAHEGREAVLRMWATLGTAFDVMPQAERMFEIGPTGVIVRGTYVGQHRESGTSVTAAFVHIVTVSDTAVWSLDQVTDTHQWHRVTRPWDVSDPPGCIV